MKIKCIRCKTDILQDHPNRKLCTNCKGKRNPQAEARRLEQQRSRYVPKITNITCAMCNKKSIKRFKSAKYCSDKCRMKRNMIQTQIVNHEKSILKLQLKIIEKRKLI